MTPHEECKLRVCAVCFDTKGRKADLGKGVMSPNMQQAMRDLVLSAYTVTDPSLPCGLCTTCRIGLGLHIKWRREEQTGKIPPKKLDIAPTYDNPIVVTTRSSLKCSCRICSYVRKTGLERKGRLQNSKPTSNILKVCGRCKLTVYPGCNHSAQLCKSKAARFENIRALAGEDINGVTAGVVREKASDAGGDTIYLDGQFNSGKLLQLRVSRPSPKPRVQLSMGDIHELRGFGMSDRQVLGTVAVLKRKDSKVVGEKRLLDRYFDKKIFETVHESTKKSKQPNKILKRPAVFCKDVVEG